MVTALHSLLRRTICLICRSPGIHDTGLCTTCRTCIKNNDTACYRCAAPLQKEGLCRRCTLVGRAFDLSIVPFLYEPPLDTLIKHTKNTLRPVAVHTLADMLFAQLRDTYTHTAQWPDVLIPVPMNKPWYTRQTNTAHSLAIAIGRASGIPVYGNAIKKIRRTPKQATLRLKDRHHNMRGAFAPHIPRAASHIAIVDDVMTSGATVEAVARALRIHAKTATITVWAIARAVPMQSDLIMQ